VLLESSLEFLFGPPNSASVTPEMFLVPRFQYSMTIRTMLATTPTKKRKRRHAIVPRLASQWSILGAFVVEVKVLAACALGEVLPGCIVMHSTPHKVFC